MRRKTLGRRKDFSGMYVYLKFIHIFRFFFIYNMLYFELVFDR
uniref:Uncharacterized protein n=1 Tax=Triticum urartu TaxID=4572 RepID=A0A8R7R454_TRIUA